MNQQSDSPSDPNDPHNLLARARQCYRQGQYIPALQAYDQLIELGAADATVWYETGATLLDVGEQAQAASALERCLQMSPHHLDAHNDLAKAYYHLGDPDCAWQHLRQITSQRDTLETWQNLATLLPGCPTANHRDILAGRRQFARRLADSAAPELQPSDDPPPARRTGNRPLRVGYVSAYFHAANYMKPVWGLINHHDRSAVAVHLFRDSLPAQGLVGYQPHSSDQLYETAALDDVQLAACLRDAEIDVLVDLNAYSCPQRLAVFLRPLAPVTMTWFNAYATTAIPGIQFVVGDDQVVRPDEEPFYSEQVVRLPLSYLTFDVSHAVPPLVPPPCTRSAEFVFGSLVTQYKITPPVLDAWAEILRRVPRARLLLANRVLKSRQNRQYVLDLFQQRGVPAEQIELLPPAEHYQYLQYYNRIDVALDAFPYNGGTTTMEALWQGVPVLTFDGDRWASRTSQTLIRRTPWARFATADLRSYIELAVELASNPATPGLLADYRRTMRDQLSRSPACDTQRLAASMEAMYRNLQP